MQAVKASTIATSLLNIHILCILSQCWKAILFHLEINKQDLFSLIQSLVSHQVVRKPSSSSCAGSSQLSSGEPEFVIYQQTNQPRKIQWPLISHLSFCCFFCFVLLGFLLLLFLLFCFCKWGKVFLTTWFNTKIWWNHYQLVSSLTFSFSRKRNHHYSYSAKYSPLLVEECDMANDCFNPSRSPKQSLGNDQPDIRPTEKWFKYVFIGSNSVFMHGFI